MDSKSLDDIMSRENETEEQVETPSVARDEQGRFAQKEQAKPEVVAEPADTPEPPIGGTVPHQALHAARERDRESRQEVERLSRELAEMRGQMTAFSQMTAKPAEQPKPVEVPEFWDKPDGFVSHHVNQALTPVQKQMQDMREGFSRSMAVEKHGVETVQAAYQAFGQAMQTDPSARYDFQRIQNSEHPYGEIVAWHQRHKVLSEIGTDPAAYEARVREKVIAELQASQTAQQQQPAARQPMPTSFASARSEGQRATPTYSGPKPLSEIMDR